MALSNYLLGIFVGGAIATPATLHYVNYRDTKERQAKAKFIFEESLKNAEKYPSLFISTTEEDNFYLRNLKGAYFSNDLSINDRINYDKRYNSVIENITKMEIEEKKKERMK